MNINILYFNVKQIMLFFYSNPLLITISVIIFMIVDIGWVIYLFKKKLYKNAIISLLFAIIILGLFLINVLYQSRLIEYYQNLPV